jgi:DnaJ like chaperone protein
MQWYGKAIGGLLGSIFGPWGSLVGIIVGHQLDQSGPLFARRASALDISRLFFEVVFEAMGQVAKIDGRVSENEIRVARGIMHGMRLGPEQVRSAIDCFTRGKDASYPLDGRLKELAAQIADRKDLALAFMQVQMQAAVGAEPIGAEKRALLWRIASALGVTRAELAQIEALVRTHGAQGHGPRRTPADDAAAIDEAYRALGVAASASNEEVKTAYRRLMNRHHPDKLVARGLPESMIGVAEQKTHEIRAAYEKIKAKRGFK